MSSTTDPPPPKRPYETPKTVVLGNVRDLTLAGGSQVVDSKAGSRGMSM